MGKPVFNEVAAGREDPRRMTLFDRVDRFAFTDTRKGRMAVQSYPLGRVTVALVRSSGHDIGLAEEHRATFIAPQAGRIAVETPALRLKAGTGSAVMLGTGYRTTEVRQEADAAFRAGMVLWPHAIRTRRGAKGTVGRAWATAGTDAAARALKGYLDYYLEERPRLGSPLSRPLAGQLAEALFLDLLSALEGTLTEPGPRELAVPENRVRRAEEIMRARCDEPLTVEDLAREVGVGARALQAAFQAHRGAAPRTVLTGIRLERAREMLATPDPSASVTDVALDCGFAHFGRFAGAYRARFGEAPSETLRRARG